MAKVIAVSISEKKGMRKANVDKAYASENFGFLGDAHASSKWHRQISLLAVESIEKMRAAGLDVGPGDFAENITTEGIELTGLPLGARFRIGDEAEGELTQIGKKCHAKCAIYELAGDCVMPKEGVFIKVTKGGWIKPGDEIAVIEQAK